MKLTQEQLAELIAKVLAGLGEKRKAAKDDGEIGVDEIMAELSEILDSSGEEKPEATDGESGEEEKVDEPADEAGSAVTPELIAEVIKALNEKKSNTPVVEAKASSTVTETKTAAPVQRKYANIFLGKSAGVDGGAGAKSFKSRISSMSAAERSKTVYGMFGRAVKCINSAGDDIEKASFIAEKKFGDSEMAREFKALSATVPSDGGYLVPEVYANEIIELLYPATTIYSLGARRLDMVNGNLNIPKVKTGSRATFSGENRVTPKSAPKFGNLKLSAKKLTALIPMSNDLLRSTNFDNDVIVGQDITKQMALGVEWGAFMGSGNEFQPLGILNNKKVQTISADKIDAAYATKGVLTAAFPNYMAAVVLKSNTYAEGLGFVFNTSVEQFFKSMRDNVGGFIFADEMNANGTLAGYPYKTTNLLETVDGKAKIIFGNWNDMIIGEQGALEIVTSKEGTWTDDSGNLVSAFENDQTLIRAINNVDVGLRHEESFAIAENVAVPV